MVFHARGRTDQHSGSDGWLEWRVRSGQEACCCEEWLSVLRIANTVKNDARGSLDPARIRCDSKVLPFLGLGRDWTPRLGKQGILDV